jgi:hypothetical protein
MTKPFDRFPGHVRMGVCKDDPIGLAEEGQIIGTGRALTSGTEDDITITHHARSLTELT